MAYIGKIPATGAFQKCDALTASGTADYTLQVGSVNVVPESVNHMIVSLNGVIQAPTTAYTVAGSTLSFASSLTSSDSIDFILLLGNVLDIGTPSDNTVAIAKIQDDAVTLAKMAAGTDGNIISYDASGNPVAIATGNDGQVLTSAGAGQPPAFEAAAGGDNKPAFQAYANSSGQDIGHSNVWTKITMDTEVFDTDGEYDHATNYRFTPQTAGKYFVYASITFATHEDGESVGANDIQHVRASIYKNGSISAGTLDWDEGNNFFVQSTKQIFALIDMNGSSDYLEAYGRNGNANNNTDALIQIGADETFFGAYKIIT